MIKVSIIMPVYNGEKYLKEALESVKRQTLAEYEMICIEDGSCDGTKSILEEYSRKDPRIKVLFNNERMGAALSRNRGVESAKGEYLAFLDSDDLWSEDMLQRNYTTAVENKADLVIFDMVYFKDGSFPPNKKVEKSAKFKNKYSSHAFSIKEYTPLDWINWDSSLGNKIYKRSFIQDHDLKFQNLSCANDVYFVDMAMLLAGRMIYAEKDAFFVYAREHSTPTRISYYRDPLCVVKATEKAAEQLKKYGLWEEMLPYFAIRYLFNVRYGLYSCSNKERSQEVYDDIRKKRWDKLGMEECDAYFSIHESVRNKLQMIKTEKDALTWCDKFDYTRMRMEHNIEKLIRLFVKCPQGIVIWGAGKRGKALIRICNDYSLKIKAVIDMESSKWGMNLEGAEIKKFEDVMDETQMVLVSASGFYQEIDHYIKQRKENIEVIDIDKLLDISNGKDITIIDEKNINYNAGL